MIYWKKITTSIWIRTNTKSILAATNSHSKNESNDTVIPPSTHKSQHLLEENQFEQIFVGDQDSVGKQTLDIHQESEDKSPKQL